MKICDLPQELEEEILSRVPATSLSQLRPTCKRWYALFKDPRFIRKNLGKAATQVILKKNHKVYSGIINIHGMHNNFDPSIEFRRKKDSEHVEISKVFHCDGLLVCTTTDDRLVVWNPCTGQIRWVQPSNGYLKRHEFSHLGYEKNNGNYKILSASISIGGSNNISVIEIYEFNSDSWRILDDVTYHWYEWYTLSEGGCVSLKGNTYWFSINEKVDRQLYSLLMFDFTTERAKRLSLPFESPCYDDDEIVFLSSVREEKLVLLRRRFDSSDSLKIWVADTKIDEEAKKLSWSYFSAVDFSKLDLKIPVGFLWDEEHKMAVFCDNDIDDEWMDKIRIQIVGENMQKEVYKEIINVSHSLSAYDRPFLFNYVPSLVHIPGGKRKV